MKARNAFSRGSLAAPSPPDQDLSTVLLFRPRRSVDRRQRLDVVGDRGAIFRRELRGVLDHAHHRSAGAVAIGHLAGLEKIADVLCAPVRKSLLGDVGHPALAFRIGPARKSLRGDDAAEEIPRAVAFRAMAKTVHEIGAAIPLRRMRGIGAERLAVHEQEFPHADIAADVERKRHVVVARFARDRRQRLQIGEEVAHVFELCVLVRRVGKGGKVVQAVRRGPLHDGGDEIGLAPAPDAVIRIGRDVRRVERAERRRDREPAAELLAIGLVGHGVTGGTSAGVEHFKAVGKVRLIGRQRARRYNRRRRQPPVNASADEGGEDGRRRMRRNIQRSVIGCINLAASMAIVSVISFPEISPVSRRFGNKSERSLFRG